LKSLKILDLDIENRPLAYLGPDFTTAEVTAIAAGWVGSSHIDVWLLGEQTSFEMLMAFHNLYDEADIVTGHYIRGHDLPILNAAMLENEIVPLDAKETQDTKLDLLAMRYLSESQENLADMLGIKLPKIHMTNNMWRESNRLTKRGLSYTEKRVVGDVKQHMALRLRLLELGYLGPTKVWDPKG
jgi:hypothetical protein